MKLNWSMRTSSYGYNKINYCLDLVYVFYARQTLDCWSRDQTPPDCDRSLSSILTHSLSLRRINGFPGVICLNGNLGNHCIYTIVSLVQAQPSSLFLGHSPDSKSTLRSAIVLSILITRWLCNPHSDSNCQSV
jgi:hypothetical protein